MAGPEPNLRDVFSKALECQSAQEQASYLEQACQGDAESRARLEELLQAHREAASFLQEPSPRRAATGARPPLTEAPGSVIGPYKLLQQIGEGGMGTVFMAEQTEPVRRKVALKIIKAGMDTRQVIARFEAERQALAMMDHVNIARVLDVGATTAGLPYFVMELVHGVPITKYCDDNRLTPRERLELFVPVCQAIQHAHQKGIIHRDIKPSNVMVTLYDGKPVPKVIDFGVAKATEQKLTERTLFTQYGTMVGTLEYMSPEQAEMSALGVDTRSDLYSLGVLLYELLTGSTPLSHKRVREAAYGEVLRMIREEEAPKPSTRLSESGEALASISAQRDMEPAKLTKLMRGELDWIVMRTLEKDRNRRYETASGFAADVHRYLNDEPVYACPPSALYRSRKFARRNKGPVLAASLVVLVLVSGIIGTSWGMFRATAAEADAVNETKQKEQALGEKDEALTASDANYREAKKQEKLAKDSEKTTQAQELLARRRFYAAQMNLAIQAWNAGQPARLLELLESQRPRFDEEDLRAFEWYYLWGLCQGRCRFRLPVQNVDNASCVAFSPDGKTLASGYGSTVKIWDAATGREQRELRGHRHTITCLAYAHDGKTLASGDWGAMVKVWDLGTAKERVTLSPGHVPFSLALTPDNKTLVSSGEAVKVWDLTTRKEQAVLRGEVGETFGFMTVTPDGNTVAAGSTHRRIRVWIRKEAGWQERTPLTGHGWKPAVAISPDGKVLAAGGSCLKLYDLTTGREQVALHGHISPIHTLAFSADGTVLVSAGHDRTVRVWDAASGQQQTCLAHPGPVYGVALACGGKRLAAMTADAIRLWELTLAPEPLVLRHTAAVRSVAFSPDGKSLASAGLDATRIWDPASGQQVATLPAGTGEKPRLVYSLDGETLATSGASKGTIDVWNLTGQRQAVLEGHTGHIDGLAFSPDGKTLASASADNTARLWDLDSRQTRLTINLPGDYSAVAFSPDAKTLAIGRQFGVVKLFDATTGREKATLQCMEAAATYTLSVAFSPDGKTLAAGNAEGTVRLWDTGTGRLRASLKGHTDSVGSLNFSADGRTLATASVDQTIKLWDVATGQERFTLRGLHGEVAAVAFAPDGNTLVTGSGDGTVKLWHAAADANARAFKRELDPDDPETPASRNALGDRLWQYGGTGEAETAYREALARLEKLAAAFPADPGYQQEMIRSLLSLSLLVATTGRSQEVEEARMRATELYRNLSSEQQHALLWRTKERSRFVNGSGNVQQAERAYSQILELLPYTTKPLRHPDIGAAWFHLGLAHAHLNQWEKSKADYTRGLELTPDSPAGQNGLAWLLATCPDANVRDPKRAVELAEKAVKLAPKEGNHWNTLGVAHYRAGDWQSALKALDKSSALRKGGDSFDWFFLGMAHWQMDRKVEARTWYDQAVEWMAKNDPRNEELGRLRAEAEQLLQVTK